MLVSIWWYCVSVGRYWLVLWVLGQYNLVLPGIKWYWVSIGLLCVYILKKKKMRFGRVSPNQDRQRNKVVRNVFSVRLLSFMYVLCFWDTKENLSFLLTYFQTIIHFWTGSAKVNQIQPCSSPFLHLFNISRFLCRLLFVFIWKISRDCGSANLHESVPLSSQNNSKRTLFNPTTFSPEP